MLELKFHGVRGSTPCSSPDLMRYGGNTSCVSLESEGEAPIVFDLGTGLRQFGTTQPLDGTFGGTVLLTHLHWDHVQGLPFFVPILRHGAELDIYAPVQEDGRPVRQAFDGFLRPPYFPVTMDHLPGEITFHDVAEERFRVGRADVLARLIPHTGYTNGYRVTWGGTSIAYLPDHQQPVDGSLDVSEGALALCEGADVIIHDAQYTFEDFAVKRTWGHCTIEFALRVAQEAEAKMLVLFHHDPIRTDGDLDDTFQSAVRLADTLGIELLVAHEGLCIPLAESKPADMAVPHAAVRDRVAV